jgi:hypothetical protein
MFETHSAHSTGDLRRMVIQANDTFTTMSLALPSIPYTAAYPIVQSYLNNKFYWGFQ